MEPKENPIIGNIYYIRWADGGDEMLLIYNGGSLGGNPLYEIIAVTEVSLPDLWKPEELIPPNWVSVVEYKKVDIKDLPLYFYFKEKFPKFSELLGES